MPGPQGCWQHFENHCAAASIWKKGCVSAHPGCTNDGVFSVQERLAFKAKKEDMLRNSFQAEGGPMPAGPVSQVRDAWPELT